MYERSTIHSRQEKRQKVHASAKASDSQVPTSEVYPPLRDYLYPVVD